MKHMLEDSSGGFSVRAEPVGWLPGHDRAQLNFHPGAMGGHGSCVVGSDVERLHGPAVHNTARSVESDAATF